MVDGGKHWQTPADAISLGRRLERYGLLLSEEPVSVVNIDGLGARHDDRGTRASSGA